MSGTGLQQLELINFRSYRRFNWHCLPQVNIIQGVNAAGKTNLLEAIGYLGCARSLRQHQDMHLVHYGESGFCVRGVCTTGYGPLEISIVYHQNHKELTINGERHRLLDILGLMPLVYFGPDDLNLIKGGPVYRRRFLDREISIIDRPYCQVLQHYRRILMQRNRLLRDIKNGRGSKSELEPWNLQMVKTGTALIKRRLAFLKDLEPAAAAVYGGMDTAHNLSFFYRPGAVPGDEWLGQINSCPDREIQAGTTLWGPHRDDFSINIGGREARFFASQGQQRSAVLALKIAQTDIFKKATGQIPVLLLDDVFSELDNRRQEALLSLLNEAGQTFITTTDITTLPAGLLKGAAIWHLNKEKGLLVRQETVAGRRASCI